MRLHVLRVGLLLSAACGWPVAICASRGEWLGALGWATAAACVAAHLALFLVACAEAERRHLARQDAEAQLRAISHEAHSGRAYQREERAALLRGMRS